MGTSSSAESNILNRPLRRIHPQIKPVGCLTSGGKCISQHHLERRTQMSLRTIATVLVAALLTAGWASAKDPPAEKREKIHKMASQTLEDLYKLHPSPQGAVQKSVGYAVFSNLGVNLLLLSTARGSGLAVNSKSKKETYMKMISAGVGIGAGVKDYRVLFLFETDQALARFIDSGWEGSAQA